eukprot:2643788-Rhodomonas_salina.4
MPISDPKVISAGQCAQHGSPVLSVSPSISWRRMKGVCCVRACVAVCARLGAGAEERANAVSRIRFRGVSSASEREAPWANGK